MKRLLQIEFQKLKHSRSARVLSIIYFALFTLIALFASIRFKFGGIDFQLADQGIFNFPYIWHFNTYFAAFLKIFLAIVIVSMMSNEYSNRTLKQNLIDGLSKKEFILSKFYTVVVFSLVSTLFIFIVSLILGIIFSDYDELIIIFSDLEYLLAYFIKLVGFFSFCMFLGIFVKKSAFALGFLFVWWIFENLLYGLIRWEIGTEEVAKNITQFFPLESISNLVKQPISKLNVIQSTANQLNTDFQFDSNVYFHQILIVLVWIFIFVWGSYALLKHRDL